MPEGYNIHIPNVQAPKSGKQPSFFTRILLDSEARASAGPEGAAGVWADKRTLAAVMEGLKRPSSGSAYTAWAGSAELRQAARVAARLLRFSAARPEAAADLQRATAAAAQVPSLPQLIPQSPYQMSTILRVQHNVATLLCIPHHTLFSRLLAGMLCWARHAPEQVLTPQRLAVLMLSVDLAGSASCVAGHHQCDCELAARRGSAACSRCSVIFRARLCGLSGHSPAIRWPADLQEPCRKLACRLFWR